MAQLNWAAAQAHAWLLAQLPTFVENWWPGSQWKVPISAIGSQTGFKWTVANYFDVDSRGIGFSSFFLPPAKLGAGSLYLGTYYDSNGRLLNGVPAACSREPVLGCVCNLEMSSFFPNSTRLTVDSLDNGLSKNADGSVDIYFGPKVPAGQESNWI